MTGHRLADRPGPRRTERGGGAEHVVALGLAVELVDGEAERRLAPGVGVAAQPLAGGADGTQPERVALARPLHRPHHPDRGRRQEGVGDAGLRHQGEGFVRVEAPERAEHHRDAEIERRQERIEEPARPRPVGRRPEARVAALGEVVGEGEAGQVPGEHPVAVQRALRRAGRAGGEDHQRRVVRARRHRREAVAVWRERLAPALDAPRPARRPR